jgi:hypothetical protein
MGIEAEHPIPTSGYFFVLWIGSIPYLLPLNPSLFYMGIDAKRVAIKNN